MPYQNGAMHIVKDFGIMGDKSGEPKDCGQGGTSLRATHCGPHAINVKLSESSKIKYKRHSWPITCKIYLS